MAILSTHAVVEICAAVSPSKFGQGFRFTSEHNLRGSPFQGVIPGITFLATSAIVFTGSFRFCRCSCFVFVAFWGTLLRQAPTGCILLCLLFVCRPRLMTVALIVAVPFGLESTISRLTLVTIFIDDFRAGWLRIRIWRRVRRG